MHRYLIDEMTAAVWKALALTADDALKVRDSLASCWQDKIALVWGVEDVIPECQGLTREEAIEVLQTLLDRHDASLGVNWDTIRTVALELHGERALEDSEDDEGEWQCLDPACPDAASMPYHSHCGPQRLGSENGTDGPK